MLSSCLSLLVVLFVEVYHNFKIVAQFHNKEQKKKKKERKRKRTVDIPRQWEWALTMLLGVGVQSEVGSSTEGGFCSLTEFHQVIAIVDSVEKG